MNKATATAALESIPAPELQWYHSYFDTIRPADDVELFRRGLFAFASVHTSWKSNLSLYAQLHELSWMQSESELRSRIEISRAGLTNNRTRFIWEFSQRFWDNPKFYLRIDSPSGKEPWSDFRDRIEDATLGLGHAKTSFFLEMVYFQEAGVVCGDTHQLQLYGLKGNSSPSWKVMNEVEQHWVGECARLNLSPCGARWYLWDRKQGRKNCRYWSAVLEGIPNLSARQLELSEFREWRRAA